MLKTTQSLRCAAVLGAITLVAGTSRADVKLPRIFSDHMVLQQQMPVPVWGNADPGEEVNVSFGEQKQSAKADDKGHWQVKLQPLTASDKPATLTVSGKNKIELSDILVGEVWICSGQSNMEMGIKGVKDGAKEVAEADHPNIRLFSVPKSVKYERQSDMAAEGVSPESKWYVCTPQNIGIAGWGGFTAAGYFFGRDLHNDLKVPVGLIHTSWGGTIAEAWAEHLYLEGDEDLAPIIERTEKTKADYAAQMKKYEADLADYKADQEAHKNDKPAQPGDPATAVHVKKQMPKKPADPMGNPNQASVLYNGMVSPLVPFAVRGVVWYQGESNAGRAIQYRKVLPAMIKSWRETFGQPEMAFYIVSLANFQQPPKDPGESDWAELREAQAITAHMPHNGQALAIDLADADNPGDIHPKDKQSVGHRLELVALAKTYGKDVAYSGPEYKESKTDGNKVVLHFNFAEGMTAKGGEPLKGFQIAGEDKKWHWATAKIDGDTVIVTSPDVEKPASVRYDWAINPQGNLYGKDGLPAVPFRTDDWPGITAKNR